MSLTRINVSESNEKYMAEESIGHRNSAEKDVQEIASNDEEGFTDCDDANADENEDGKFSTFIYFLNKPFCISMIGNFGSNGYNWA